MDKKSDVIDPHTRTFQTTKGKLTYAELADLVAPKLLAIQKNIIEGAYSERTLDESLILDFHKMLLDEIMPENAGQWRKVMVMVGNHIPPEPFEIPQLIRVYFDNLRTRLEFANTIELKIELLAYAEGELLHIHPFIDFNGRVTRLLLSEILVRLDFPQVDVSVQPETEEFHIYQNALASYDNGNLQPLIEFWGMRLS
ncbi:MAG: Fic family protein [Candidatus Ancillula sp.]|jgi:Fic family protein|nr:Fic family protein [Candidatus Ancillula sp.]